MPDHNNTQRVTRRTRKRALVDDGSIRAECDEDLLAREIVATTVHRRHCYATTWQDHGWYPEKIRECTADDPAFSTENPVFAQDESVYALH
jgi:hypothetical protein